LVFFHVLGAAMGLDLKKVASECRSRAAEYKKKAEIALFHSDRSYYADMAQQWVVIAQGYEAHLLRREIVMASSLKSRKR
jgi:hypothetical protein